MASIESLASQNGLTSNILINNAGSSIASWIKNNITDPKRKTLMVLVGKGKNGSDGLVAANQLSKIFKKVTIVMPLNRNEDLYSKGLNRAGIEIIKVVNKKDLGKFKMVLDEIDILLDAILGTGINRPIGSPLNEIIRLINASKSKVFSIDIPSGIDPDTGEKDTYTVKAHTTLMLGYPKLGCVNGLNPVVCGNLEVIDIGLPRDSNKNVDHLWIKNILVKSMLGERDPKGHKGTFGTVAVVAGSPAYVGAGILTTLGALHSGVGMVTVFTPESQKDVIATKIPEAVFVGLIEEITREEIDPVKSYKQFEIHSERNKFTSLVVGPGLSTSKQAQSFIRNILENIHDNIPVVIDADALNTIATNKIEFTDMGSNKDITITPHVGEMSRLSGISKKTIESNRIQVAKEYAHKQGINVVLKGPATVIATQSGEVFISPWINSGLSKAGSGDVLAGLIAGLNAQTGFSSLQACITGVYIHGLSGEYSRRKYGARSMRVLNIVDELSNAFKNVENTH
jgi:NAD(P)H-hydrate epimerase